MIQLLGSKSTDYLGKLLSSHSKKESCAKKLCETGKSVSGGHTNCESKKEALSKPLGLSSHTIDLTKAPSKHDVIDLTKDESPKKSERIPPPSTLASTLKVNKIDFTKCRNAVRRLDRSCLMNTVGGKRPLPDEQCKGAVSSGITAVQASVKPHSLNVHPSAHTPTNVKSNPEYIFHNRRFLHASLDTPSLEKKANRVSPLSSPAKIMAHLETQSNNLKPVVTESQQGMEYYQKLMAARQKGKEDKTESALNSGETSVVLKKDIVKRRGRKPGKTNNSKKKETEKRTEGKSKKNDVQVGTKRKTDEVCLRPQKKTKIDVDDILLPDFARVKQSDLRCKRLEKFNQELSVMFIITSDEGLEVRARTCEG